MTAVLAMHPILGGFAATLLTILALGLMARGGVFILRGLRHPDHPDQSVWVVRGFRRVIVAIGLAFTAGGFYWAAAWPFIFAAVFLGEELFETGIMLAALGDQRREVERASKSPARNRTA